MKINIAHDKKIIKREKKTQNTPTKAKAKVQKMRAKSAVAAVALTSEEEKANPITTVEVETSVLAIDDYGVFMIDNNGVAEPIEGRIIEISDESTEKDPVLIFRMDVSTEYNSALKDVISTNILNWTKSGEETIDISDLLKYSYEDDKSLVVTTDSSEFVVRVNDIVEITNTRTNEVKTGRISSILTNQVSVDCSSKGYSDVYVIDGADLENDNIILKVVNK